jgi:hypothetical protein
MDPLTEARLRVLDARIRRDKRGERRALKAYNRLTNPTIFQQWLSHFKKKLRPPEKSEGQRLVDEIVNALRERGRRR